MINDPKTASSVWFDELISKVDKSNTEQVSESNKTEDLLFKVQDEVIKHGEFSSLEKVRQYYVQKKITLTKRENITYSLIRETIMNNPLSSLDIETSKEEHIKMNEQA